MNTAVFDALLTKWENGRTIAHATLEERIAIIIFRQVIAFTTHHGMLTVETFMTVPIARRLVGELAESAGLNRWRAELHYDVLISRMDTPTTSQWHGAKEPGGKSIEIPIERVGRALSEMLSKSKGQSKQVRAKLDYDGAGLLYGRRKTAPIVESEDES